MTRAELARLREVSVSAEIMLESPSRRLCGKGGPHYGSPDKDPAVRLATLERAGELAVPFTTGILIGIGETRRERVESLLAIRALDDRRRHVQEMIVQNFRAKPGTPMAAASEPSLEDHLWTIAVARLVLGPGTSVQAPPNLRPGALARLVDAGLDDWGGVSPVTPDHVNPEAPWPHLIELECATEAADALRRERNGDVVSYVVNRNINYTNVCYFRCRFCAFSKGRLSANLRGRPYDLDLAEIARRTREAWDRGATEICLQGGIHPDYTGETYLSICRAVKDAAPEVHVHAFSPLEVWQGARTLDIGLPGFLGRLRAAGLGSLPGTAAEILDDEVRRELCPDKIATVEWLEVMETAHRAGLGSTATIMFGHVDGYRSWARHLLRVRALAERTGGFTEFVPLPFVHMESPMYLRGRARRGPTLREAVLMHAVARLALDPWIVNIQASWVKMGPDGMRMALAAGANDVGGTLMNESITRAAGAGFGQEMPPERLESVIREAGRSPRQRTTRYSDAPAERGGACRSAPPRWPNRCIAVDTSWRTPASIARMSGLRAMARRCCGCRSIRTRARRRSVARSKRGSDVVSRW